MLTDAEHAAALRKFLDYRRRKKQDLLITTEAAIERAIELLELNHAKKQHQAEVLRRMGEQAEEQGLEY